MPNRFKKGYRRKFTYFTTTYATIFGSFLFSIKLVLLQPFVSSNKNTEFTWECFTDGTVTCYKEGGNLRFDIFYNTA